MKKSKVHILIIFTLITSIVSTWIAYSRYISSVSVSDEGNIAIPILSNMDNEILVNIKPGENFEYEFGVSNQIENKTSEVTMQYNIKLETFKNLPLKYELYTYENEVLGDINLLDVNMITENFYMEIQEAEIVHKYKLLVKWDEEDNNYLYSKETEYLKIEIGAEQVD